MLEGIARKRSSTRIRTWNGWTRTSSVANYTMELCLLFSVLCFSIGLRPEVSYCLYALIASTVDFLIIWKSFHLERIEGFEPSPSVWKTDVLAVEHYTHMFLVPETGIEPMASSLQERRSSN